MTSLRCAIYTRKSSDEGLEQDFNSLDAQREACAAYVLSQASEGWRLSPEHYDDGGLSGGTLERPALQHLLKDVRAGRVDIIVVYKVDRLTRSLIDFAKLVEEFDKAQVSFISVTQSFNTTTSMGRLTLNMLLSFAQFEREVTAERIRDKIAASKAKGMWMGGIPPLGYRPNGRSLAIVEEHAELVRDIFARYRSLSNVRLVADALEADGVMTPLRTTLNGKTYGGCRFTRGQLYTILKNPIYAGDIAHKGKVYSGNHPAIIEREVWDAVQQQLADNLKGVRKTREANAGLLAGLLFDDAGEPLIPVHTTKGKQRYRYYVRKSDQHGTASPHTASLRIPAREIEQVVTRELATLLADPINLLERCKLQVAPALLNTVIARSAKLSARLRKSEGTALRKLVKRAEVHPDRIALTLAPAGLAELLGIASSSDTPGKIAHQIAVRLKRSGHAMRFIQEDGSAAASKAPDPALAKLLVKARKWWRELAGGECNIADLSRRENIRDSYITKVVRLAFLSPTVVEAILAGEIRAEVDGKALLATGAMSPRWEKQATKFLPVPR